MKGEVVLHLVPTSFRMWPRVFYELTFYSLWPPHDIRVFLFVCLFFLYVQMQRAMMEIFKLMYSKKIQPCYLYNTKIRFKFNKIGKDVFSILR